MDFYGFIFQLLINYDSEKNGFLRVHFPNHKTKNNRLLIKESVFFLEKPKDFDES